MVLSRSTLVNARLYLFSLTVDIYNILTLFLYCNINFFFFEISITCGVRLTECDINENNKQQYKSGSEYLCIIPEPS